jgi:hypothetical protein
LLFKNKGLTAIKWKFSSKVPRKYYTIGNLELTRDTGARQTQSNVLCSLFMHAANSAVFRACAKGSGLWRVILVDATGLYPAVASPETGLAKIILAEIKEAGRRIKLLPWKWATRNREHFI